MGGKTGHVMTLANSIIGVGILAMPFCFQKCGIILSIVLLMISNTLTRISCYYLMKSSILCRRRSFEMMAFHIFGSSGKLIVELCVIGYLMGTCVTYYVVVGDLGPPIVAKLFNIELTDTLRTWTMIIVTLVLIIPLGLLRNIDSLTIVCTASIGFYFCLVMKVIAESKSHISAGDWTDNVDYWKVSGILQCLPIFSMALACQMQLFEVYETVLNPSLAKMNGMVKAAINICTGVYILVGFFGYVAFCTQPFSGNILLNLSSSFVSEVIKIGFVLSVAFSFPLVIFPCRVSLYSLLYRKGHSEVAHYIPEHRFRLITVILVTFGLIVGILIPSIELVIGFVGSTIGVAICVLFPASCAIKVAKKNSTEKLLAKMFLIFGFFVMVLGTYANLKAIEVKHSSANKDLESQHPINSKEKLSSHVLENLTDSFYKLPVIQDISLIDTIDNDIESNKNLLKPISNLNIKKPDVKLVQKPIIVNIVTTIKKNVASSSTNNVLSPEKPLLMQKVKVPSDVKNDVKKDVGINNEAIQREDREIAIDENKKLIVEQENDQLKKTKELLKAQVDEFKYELEKQNEKTQQLVREKFEEIAKKVDKIEKGQKEEKEINEANRLNNVDGGGAPDIEIVDIKEREVNIPINNKQDVPVNEPVEKINIGDIEPIEKHVDEPIKRIQQENPVVKLIVSNNITKSSKKTQSKERIVNVPISQKLGNIHEEHSNILPLPLVSLNQSVVTGYKNISDKNEVAKDQSPIKLIKHQSELHTPEAEQQHNENEINPIKRDLLDVKLEKIEKSNLNEVNLNEDSKDKLSHISNREKRSAPIEECSKTSKTVDSEDFYLNKIVARSDVIIANLKIGRDLKSLKQGNYDENSER